MAFPLIAPAIGLASRFLVRPAIRLATNPAARAQFMNAIKSPFTKAKTVVNPATGKMSNITKAVNGVDITQRGFSAGRTITTLTGASIANELTGGIIGDAALSVVKPTASTISFVGGYAANGTAEFVESADEILFDGQGKHWLEESMDRLGFSAQPFTDENGFLIEPDDYETIYNQLPAEERAEYMAPEKYAEQHPELLAEQQALIQNSGLAQEQGGPETSQQTAPQSNPLGSFAEADIDALDGRSLSNMFSQATNMATDMNMDLGWQFNIYTAAVGFLSAVNIFGWADEMIEGLQRHAIDMVQDEVVNQGENFFGVTDTREFEQENAPRPGPTGPQPAAAM